MRFICIVKMYIILFITLVVFFFDFHVVHLLVDCGYIYKYETRRNKIICMLLIHPTRQAGERKFKYP